MSRNLKKYREMRDFRKTSEPKGNALALKGRWPRNLFVIQKHDASRLHYDFRLRDGGRLVSWAVPKGVSTVPNEKHLAMRTEDHPLDYANFEGIIPQGEYGGGTVMVWDTGTYDLDDVDMDEALKKGRLKFTLHGEKLSGAYAMARTGRERNKERWIIFKLDDNDPSIRRNPLKNQPKSVLTNRTMNQIAKDKDRQWTSSK